MSTVGYGDITPVTNIEKFASIILTIISCGVFAFTINTIDQIIRDKQQKEINLKRKKYDITQYMNKRNISKIKQVRVIKELEYLEIQEQNGNIKGLSILNQLSNKIQDDVFIEYYGRVLENSKFSKMTGYSQKFIKKMSTVMQEITFGPGEIVYDQDKQDNKYYFLMEGSLEIYFEKKSSQGEDIHLTFIKGQQEIGHRNFYSQLPLNYTVRSCHISRLVYFTREDMCTVLKKFPQDFQLFSATKDNITYNQNRLGERCMICQSWVHNSSNCPFVHHISRKYQIIGKYNGSQDNQRQKNTQNIESRAFNALMDKEEIREELMRIRTDLLMSFLNEVYDYDQEDEDIDFYYDTPKITFLEDGNMNIGDETDDEDEQFFIEEEEIITQNDIQKQLNNQVQIVQQQNQHQHQYVQRYSQNTINLGNNQSNPAQKLQTKPSITLPDTESENQVIQQHYDSKIDYNTNVNDQDLVNFQKSNFFEMNKMKKNFNQMNSNNNIKNNTNTNIQPISSNNLNNSNKSPINLQTNQQRKKIREPSINQDLKSLSTSNDIQERQDNMEGQTNYSRKAQIFGKMKNSSQQNMFKPRRQSVKFTITNNDFKKNIDQISFLRRDSNARQPSINQIQQQNQQSQDNTNTNKNSNNKITDFKRQSSPSMQNQKIDRMMSVLQDLKTNVKSINKQITKKGSLNINGGNSVRGDQIKSDPYKNQRYSNINQQIQNIGNSLHKTKYDEIFESFDRMYTFKHYFKLSNYSIIIKNYNKKHDQFIKSVYPHIYSQWHKIDMKSERRKTKKCHNDTANNQTYGIFSPEQTFLDQQQKSFQTQTFHNSNMNLKE